LNGSAIAIIPARGGSKRVPRKNVKEMWGKPLIAYTIEAALQSGIFKRVVVSTDCNEIAAAAAVAGAEVPFLREPALADDITPVSAATVDMLLRLDPEGDLYSHVCQLMANCPLRGSEAVVASYRQFVASDSRSQISITRFGWQNPWWAMRRGSDYTLEPLFQEMLASRSQDLPALYCPTGAIWWANAAILRQAGTFHVPGRTGWEIDWRQGMDIDTQDDWSMAETLMAMARNNSGPIEV
jgi:CMP-N-acetylneuraminic acid synthetase